MILRIENRKWMKKREAVASLFLWQEGDLNSRPRAYESPALPLSYPANGNGLLTNPKKYCQLKFLAFLTRDIDKPL